ncbi:hypothetical protein Aperf_G00000067428 [Anoplocephala perfoliata]
MEKIFQSTNFRPDTAQLQITLNRGGASITSSSCNDFWSSYEFQALQSRTFALLSSSISGFSAMRPQIPFLLSSKLRLDDKQPSVLFTLPKLPALSPPNTTSYPHPRKFPTWMIPSKQKAKELLKEPIHSPPLESENELLRKLPHLLLPRSVCDTANGLAATIPDATHKCHKCMCPLCLVALFGHLIRVTPQKLHFCWKCCKLYGKTSHLSAHLRNHSNTRPYKCNYYNCTKAFTRSDELQRHFRTHTGEKKFQCQECGKGFTRSDHLNKHRKIHRPPATSEEKSSSDFVKEGEVPKGELASRIPHLNGTGNIEISIL